MDCDCIREGFLVAFNPSPDVAMIREWAQKKGHDIVIMIGLSLNSGTYKIVSYGKNRQLCQESDQMAERLERLMDQIYCPK